LEEQNANEGGNDVPDHDLALADFQFHDSRSLQHGRPEPHRLGETFFKSASKALIFLNPRWGVSEAMS
jgi:hypothetical protein